MFREFQSLLVVPVVAFGASTVIAEDGGTSPLEPKSSVRLVLDQAQVSWGQTVKASGGGLRRSQGRVTLWLEAASGSRKRLGSALPSRSGKWSIRFKATSRGSVVGAQGAVFAGPSAIGGRTLRVRTGISMAPTVLLSANGRARVSAKIAPKGRWQWSLVRRTSQGNVQLAHGATSTSGLVLTSVNAKRGDRLQLLVASGGGLEGSVKPAVVARLRPAVASWYGLYGDGVACGGTLGVNQIWVAHKTLPCGTRVTISYRGRTIVAPVIDRGPFIAGREFDLTGAAARALRFDGVGTIWVSP